MLLFWFIVVDPLLSAVALAPLVIWRHGNPRYHPWIVVGCAFLLLTLAPPAIWRAWRGWRATLRDAPPENAAWPRGATPAAFAVRLRLYLQSTGWRVIEATATAEGHLLVRAARDRVSATLLFAAPGIPVTPLALRNLPPAATIVTPAKPTAEERARISRAGFTALSAASFAGRGLSLPGAE